MATTFVDTEAGKVVAIGEADDGTITGSPYRRALEPDSDYRLRVSTDNILLSEQFPGAALNSALWNAPVTTHTVAVASGFLVLNNGSSVAASGVSRVTSYRSFPLYQAATTWFECIVSFPFTPQNNNTVEWGLGIATGTTAPTDGVFFRLNSSGEFRAIINVNGVETQSGTLDFSTIIGVNVARKCVIGVNDDWATFWVDDKLVARVDLPTAGPVVTASGSLPILLRNYVGGSPMSSAQQLKVSQVTVSVGGHTLNKPLAEAMCGAGLMGYQGQTGGTMGTTASYANSADPTASAALSNTATLVTGLGGQFRFNAAATAVTDGIVTSYQVPAGTAAIPGRSLYIRGIKISCANLGAAVATTATTLAWSLAFGHTAVSLATAEAATTKAPRRVALGIQSWPVGAAIGASPDRGDLYMPFAAPIVVNPGEFVATVAKFVVGTATASQVIWGHITFDCYWE